MNKVDYKQSTQEAYDATAVQYKENTQKISTEMKAERFLIHARPPGELLDVGCGAGVDAKYFTEQGFKVTGVDISPRMIELAAKDVPEATFQVMDGEQMDFPKEQFDAVWACASLLHVPKEKMEGVLRQIVQFTKEGGIFYISMKQGEGEILETDKRYGKGEKFWAYYQEQELIQVLEKVGFAVLEHHVHDKSTTYQTHAWISIICKNTKK